MPNKIAEFLFTKTNVPAIQKYLDLASGRHKLIAGNMANVSTPGYKARDIDFQAEFLKATDKSNHLKGKITDAGHIPLGQHKDKSPRILESRIKGGEINSVDIDKEVSKLAQNDLLFNVSATLLRQKFDGIRKAITSK